MNTTMSEIQLSFKERFPTLSLAERDRRYEKVRELLDKHRLDALVLVGGGRDKLDRYLAKEAIAGAVVFPREGDPTLICRFNVMPLLRHIRLFRPDSETSTVWRKSSRVQAFARAMLSSHWNGIWNLWGGRKEMPPISRERAVCSPRRPMPPWRRRVSGEKTSIRL